MNQSLILNGIDGSNPLGFLSALGSILIARHFCPNVRLSWKKENCFWRPVIWEYQSRKEDFTKEMYQSLQSTSSDPFLIDKKLPFSSELFRSSLLVSKKNAAPGKRREIDLLAGLGSEIHFDKNGLFKDTAFRMIRSGDSAGQGLPAYALAIRKNINIDGLYRTLFKNWDYSDDEYNLRWDPLEDQRYALRWYNPEFETNKKYAPRTMRGANVLSLEALAFFPVQPLSSGEIATTCFSRFHGRDFFTWPIWERPISSEVIKSLLSLSDIHKNEYPSRQRLARLGIIDIFRCERIAPNKYYKNFSPAVPV
jgi:hypothetical protein